MKLTHQDQEQPELVELFWRTRWDFFTGGSSSKAGYVTDLQEKGCTLKTDEPIEFRRWIRMMIRDPRTELTFTAVGRVIRCENSFEASVGSDVTLYRYQVEFTYPVAAVQTLCGEASPLVRVSNPEPKSAQVSLA